MNIFKEFFQENWGFILLMFLLLLLIFLVGNNAEASTVNCNTWNNQTICSGINDGEINTIILNNSIGN